MLRRGKLSKNEVVAPKEKEDYYLLVLPKNNTKYASAANVTFHVSCMHIIFRRTLATVLQLITIDILKKASYHSSSTFMLRSLYFLLRQKKDTVSALW
jgi:hypothetical protein